MLMYSVGVFYAWDWLFLLCVMVAYLLCPKKIIEKKNEYVKFFLFFLSGYFFLFFILNNLIQNKEITHQLFGVLSPLALFVFHLLYPFKEVKRNQHLSFFLFWIALFCVGLGGLIILLHGMATYM